MAVVVFNLKNFTLKMNNIVKYSNGFIDGIHSGKKQFINNLGASTIAALYAFIDANARMDKNALHHVYEWYKVGSPDARLFDLNYTPTAMGLSIRSTFKQSKTVADGSFTPFYDKAKIMEEGIPVTISPKNRVLVFEVDGETVFTPNEVTVENPGGQYVEGAFERVFNQFMLQYFKQSFLRASGLFNYLEKPIVYKKNIAAGSKGGRQVGIKTGHNWMSNAKVVV